MQQEHEGKPFYKCNFLIAWVGRCKSARTHESLYCEKHKGAECGNCGAQASRECDHTIGPMICGQKLCGLCRCRCQGRWGALL